MEIISHPSKQIDCLLGDVYYGHLVPTVICGRTHCLKLDINTFLTHWCNKIFNRDLLKVLKVYYDFGLEQFGIEFKERMFSKILVISPKENLTDAWQILWGVWSDQFLNGPENKPSDYILYYKVSCIFLMFYLYFSQSGSHNLPIPLSLDTFDKCLEVSDTILVRFKVSSVFNVLNYMVNHKCITFSSWDGLQYLYQNKFGNPLKINK